MAERIKKQDPRACRDLLQPDPHTRTDGKYSEGAQDHRLLDNVVSEEPRTAHHFQAAALFVGEDILREKGGGHSCNTSI